ncbi:MAG: DUF1801 domain-containing protein [Bryobacterales bacterium]|nr:DUF1801 domain-containing protein [Bryobacterales bacterium]
MPNTDFHSVDEYIAAQPEAVRPLLEEVRRAILQALPAAEEVISYQIPAYRVMGTPAIYFAAWKSHFSLYPASAALIKAFLDDLAPYKVEKSTIRFPLSGKAPAGLIRKLAKFRAREVEEYKHAKAAAKVARKAR